MLLSERGIEHERRRVRSRGCDRTVLARAGEEGRGAKMSRPDERTWWRAKAGLVACRPAKGRQSAAPAVQKHATASFDSVSSSRSPAVSRET
eukprot:5554945-Pleurochrysis_carterae.AAC.2